ncbi:MAG TPA: SRPBCC domain-containing protein, partial [Thermoanaerobaculia bacterium]|nr:SRPBCC domain-containing protein [Thermoanaerobaculia bacterium]
MSVKIDESGRRSVQVEVEVPGTPEEVWRAIATGPGVSSWFVPCEVDERDGGSVTCHFGPGMDSVATVTAWDPPHRFAAASADLGPEAPPIATEWIVEARSGDTCVVRVVHSLFASTDDWDNQLEGFESGWPGFFRILRLYLTHFKGLPSAYFSLMAASPAPVADVWKTFTSGLGLQEGSAAGQRLTASAAGAPPLAGIVDWTGDAKHPHVLFLRLDEPTSGVASLGAHRMGDQTYLMISFYLYGD